MMTVLRELKNHVIEHVTGDKVTYSLDKSDNASLFKIVYVAPMKALAAEVVAKFSKRLAYLGVVVRELTGDMQLTRVR